MYRVSQRRACGLLDLWPRIMRYQSVKDRQDGLRMRLRDLAAECLNQHWFTSLSDAKTKIDQWREDYNEARPHESLGYLAPSEFARNSQKARRPEPV